MSDIGNKFVMPSKYLSHVLSNEVQRFRRVKCNNFRMAGANISKVVYQLQGFKAQNSLVESTTSAVGVLPVLVLIASSVRTLSSVLLL